MIYLDYAANTPVDEEVLETYIEATRKYIANPNSNHPLGLEAKEKIDASSKIIADYFNTDSKNIIYTSGSSESNNLVIKGIAESNKDKGNKIIISAVEHSSVVAPCNYLSEQGYDISIIPLTKEGKVDLEVLKEELDDNTILVSICSVDSELGTIQPIEEIAKIVKKSNAYFHTDATQAIGKAEIDYSNVDFVTFAPHKFYGINGSGVLVNTNNVKMTPLIHGGKSTTIYRSGTPVTANIIATSKAFVLAREKYKERYNHIKELNDILRESLSKIECVHINSPIDAIPNTLNISLIGKDTAKVLEELESNQIYVSTTTACSMKGSPSRSVLAITGSEELASNTIRLSMSHVTTKEEIEKFLEVFKKIIKP